MAVARLVPGVRPSRRTGPSCSSASPSSSCSAPCFTAPRGHANRASGEGHRRSQARAAAAVPVGVCAAACASPAAPGPRRGDAAVCHAKKGKYGESYVFQVIRGDNEEDEMLFRRFKRHVVSSHVLLEARCRKTFEGKIDRHKRKLKMRSIEKKLRVPIMTMAQRREMEAAGKIPGYNPLTRSPFLADISPSMSKGMMGGGGRGSGGRMGGADSSAPGAKASQQPSASDIFLGGGLEGEMDVESLFGSKNDASASSADPLSAIFSSSDDE